MISIGQFFRLTRVIDKLLTLETTQREAMSAVNIELNDIRRRLIRLEAREAIVVEQAKGAATLAATTVMVHAVTDMARRIGAPKVRVEPYPGIAPPT